MDNEEDIQLYSFNLRFGSLPGECCSLGRRALFWSSSLRVQPIGVTATGALGPGAGTQKHLEIKERRSSGSSREREKAIGV